MNGLVLILFALILFGINRYLGKVSNKLGKEIEEFNSKVEKGIIVFDRHGNSFEKVYLTKEELGKESHLMIPPSFKVLKNY